MSNLKEQLIKLGHTNPELRPHLNPVLDKLSSIYKQALLDGRTRQYILDEIVLQARQNGQAYQTRDARSAVDEAAKDMTKHFFNEMRNITQEAVQKLRESWEDTHEVNIYPRTYGDYEKDR